MPKPLTVWITTNCGTFFKKWEYRTTWTVSWEICMQVKNWTWNNRLVPKWERSTSRLYILSPWLFNLYAEYIMRNARLDESQAGIKLLGEMSIPHIRRWHHPYGIKRRGTKEPLKVKEESEKAGLKLNIQKTKIMASGAITSWQIDGETMETVTDFLFS